MAKRSFLRIVLLAALVVFGLGVEGVFAAAAPPKEAYYGNWVVSKVIMATKDATLSASKKKSFISKVLMMAATSASFDGKKLANPSYQISEMTAADFLSSWVIDAKKLGLGAQITMVEVYSGKGMTSELWSPIGTIFMKPKAVGLVMHVDGVFFALVPKKK